MIHIEQRKRIHLLLRAACLTTIALLYSPLSSFWSSVAWGQQSATQMNSSVQAQAEPKRRPRPIRAAQPSPVEPSAPDPTTTAADPSSALGSELESCDKADGVEPVSLPGAKGEIKLDRCYRGRDRLVCSFRALSSEAKFLLENYRKIVDANYPELGSVDDVCRIEPDNLVTDLKNTADFADRFRALKSQYDARVNCANKIEQSLRDVTLPDMTQAPAMLKSMIDSIEGDIKGVSAPQAQLVEFAERINSSHKALLTIQKIHQTMCGRDQTAKVDAEGGSAAPSVLESASQSPSGNSSPSGSSSPSASANAPATARYYVVLDPVDSCAVLDTKPSAISALNTLGDKNGYTSVTAANKALNAAKAKCKRAVIE
jgi:hypothetical protein